MYGMFFDFDRYEILEDEIKKFRVENPEYPNLMTKKIRHLLDIYWQLIDEQCSLFKLILDTLNNK